MNGKEIYENIDIKSNPFEAVYAAIYGIKRLMSDWDLNTYRTKEEVYEKCLEKGVTWEELLNYKKDDDVLL